MPMREIKQVAASLSNRSTSQPAGRVTVGYYVLEDGLLTMTDGEGEPIRGRDGLKITHKLQTARIRPSLPSG